MVDDFDWQAEVNRRLAELRERMQAEIDERDDRLKLQADELSKLQEIQEQMDRMRERMLADQARLKDANGLAGGEDMDTVRQGLLDEFELTKERMEAYHKAALDALEEKHRHDMDEARSALDAKCADYDRLMDEKAAAEKAHNEAMFNLRAEMDAKMNALRGEFEDRVRHLQTRCDDLEAELKLLKDTNAAQLAQLQERLRSMAREKAELEESLLSRIRELETSLEEVNLEAANDRRAAKNMTMVQV